MPNKTKSNAGQPFDLAILYWFYKEPEVTKNHLQMIRRHNPGRKIYGLFGGQAEKAKQYQKLLTQLDDFWIYPGTYGDDNYSKWIHGDLMLLDWYQKRGRDLPWDSLAITQWDMLVMDDVANLTPGLQKDQLFFSGYRDMDQELEERWSWTKPGSQHRQDYLDFTDFVVKEYGYQPPLKACLFIYEVLTRPFFDGLGKLADKKLGMLEYKDPTLAVVLGLSALEHDLGVFWSDKRPSIHDSPLNGRSVELAKSYIEAELTKPDGWRLFHPYKQNWP
jgi:hypothetical protein